jgi:pimeloyl-ACP methyl ester carboxylesterase
MSIRAGLVVLACLIAAASSARADPAIVGTEHKVPGISAADNKPLSLYLWEKRRKDADPKARVVLLAHGATISGRVDFDVQVPPDKNGLPYSLMDELASQGYDVFSLDYQNYGRSDHHPCGLCVTTQAAANDINAAVDYIRKLRNVDKVDLLGWSWGASTTGLFAQQHPEKVRRLIQYAACLQGGAGQAPQEQFRKTELAKCCQDDFIPEFTDPGVYETYGAEALKWDPQAPNGVRADFATKTSILDPKQIKVPTMMIYGALDSSCTITQDALPGYFRDLATLDKQLIIVPEGGHALLLMKPRGKFFREVLKWLEL